MIEFRAPKPENVVLEAITLPGQVDRYDLIAEFLRMRKRVFVDEKAWPLFYADGLEFEQYDTFDTTYILAHDGKKVFGGARLRRTDMRAGAGSIAYTYMIRDAFLGLLPNMPKNLCYSEPPMDSQTWELTRLVATGGPNIVEQVLVAANEYIYQAGGSRCLFLGSPAFLRMAKRLGWEPAPLGDVVGNNDGRFVAFGCGIRKPITGPKAPISNTVSVFTG